MLHPRSATARVQGRSGAAIANPRRFTSLPTAWEGELVPGANGPLRGFIAGQTGSIDPDNIGQYAIARLAAGDAGGGNFYVDLRLAPISGIDLDAVWVQFDAIPVVPLTFNGSDFASTIAATWQTQFDYLNTNIGNPVAVTITDAAP